MKREIPPAFNREALSDEQQIIRSFLAIVPTSAREMRWSNEDKSEEAISLLKQSLLEHTAGMQILAKLILAKENTELDVEKISTMIDVHDIGETIVGDKIRKTPEDREEEHTASTQITDLADKFIPNLKASEAYGEYEERTTPEALFVKAIDRLEAILTMIAAKRSDRTSFTREEEDRIAETITSISPLLYKTYMTAVRLITQQKYASEQFSLDV